MRKKSGFDMQVGKLKSLPSHHTDEVRHLFTKRRGH